ENREKVSEMEEAVRSLGDANTELMEKNDQFEKACSEKQMLIENMRAASCQHTENLAEVKSQLKTMSEEFEQKQEQCQQLEEELASAREIEEHSSNTAVTNVECAVCIKRNEPSLNKIQTLKTKIEEINLSKEVGVNNEELLKQREERIKELTEEKRVLEEKLVTAEEKVADVESEMERLVLQNLNQDGELENIQAQLEKVKNLTKVKVSECEMMKNVATLEEKIKEKDDEINERKMELDAAHEKMKILEKMDEGSDHHECHEKISNLQEEIDLLKLEQKRKINEVLALSEVSRTVSEEMDELRRVLDEKIQALDQLNDEKCKLEEELAKKTKDLESSASSLEEHKKSCSELEYEISSLRCCLNEDQSELMRLLEDRKNLSEVEKNFIALYQQFSKLSEEQQKMREENLQQIKDLEEDLASVKCELEEKITKCEMLTSRVQELTEQLDDQSTTGEAEILSLRSKMEEESSLSSAKIAQLSMQISELENI
uniref:Uncharacterized protein n=1 Tax=Ciona intestinalis TaxID=7719 RepID=H2XPK4_CIOIN